MIKINRVGDIKQKLIIIAMIFFVLALSISLYYLIINFFEFRNCNKANVELVDEVIVNKEHSSKIQIDWEKMNNINEDIIGWIKIDDTNINYPILKDNENLKYLKHSYDGLYNSNGSIFTIDNKPFNQDITTIYGHNMKNGIMFSELSKYMDKEFLNNHRSFEIYTKSQQYKATIFSVYSIGIKNEENNIRSLNFNDEIEYYKKISKYSIENIGEIKKIIKLSTCSYINNHTIPTDQRYFMVAKLEKVN